MSEINEPLSNPSLASQLYKGMLRRGWYQSQLARDSGLPQGTLSNLAKRLRLMPRNERSAFDAALSSPPMSAEEKAGAVLAGYADELGPTTVEALTQDIAAVLRDAENTALDRAAAVVMPNRLDNQIHPFRRKLAVSVLALKYVKHRVPAS